MGFVGGCPYAFMYFSHTQHTRAKSSIYACVFVYWNIQYRRAFWYMQRHVLFYYIKIFHKIVFPYASFAISTFPARTNLMSISRSFKYTLSQWILSIWYGYFIKFCTFVTEAIGGIHIHAYMHVCMHACVCTYVYVCICLRVCMNSLAQRNQIFLLHVVEHYFDLFIFIQHYRIILFNVEFYTLIILIRFFRFFTESKIHALIWRAHTLACAKTFYLWKIPSNCYCYVHALLINGNNSIAVLLLTVIYFRLTSKAFLIFWFDTVY